MLEIMKKKIICIPRFIAEVVLNCDFSHESLLPQCILKNEKHKASQLLFNTTKHIHKCSHIPTCATQEYVIQNIIVFAVQVI